MPCFSCDIDICYVNIRYSVIWALGLAAFAGSASSTCHSCHLFATYLPLFVKAFFSKTPSQSGFIRGSLPLCHFFCHFLLCSILLCLGAGNCHFLPYKPIYLLFKYKVIKKWQSGKNLRLTRGFTTFGVAKSGKFLANYRQISQKMAKGLKRAKPKPRVEFRS